MWDHSQSSYKFSPHNIFTTATFLCPLLPRSHYMPVYTLVLLGGYEHKRMKMNNEHNMSPTIR